MTTLLFALLLQCFFPLFDASSLQFVGLSVVNSDAQSREYVVTTRHSDGAGVQDARFSLPAGNQRAFLLPEVMPAPTSAGWIQVDSAAPGCFSYLSTGDGRSYLTGTDAAATTGTVLIVPHVEVHTGFAELAHLDTSVSIVNPGATSTRVTMQLFGLDGAPKGSSATDIPARGSRVVMMSQEFGASMPSNGLGGRTFSGYLRLNADAGIAAWQRIEGVLSRSILRARPITELRSTPEAFIPHFAVGGDYGSFLNIINPGTSALDLEMVAQDDRGRTLGEPVRLTLAPGEGRRASVESFFRFIMILIYPPPLITGSIRIREAAGRNFQIAGDVEIFDRGLGGRDSAMLYPISDSASTSWTLPFAATSGMYFTGLALLNPNALLTVQTDVVVEFVGPDGFVRERKAIQLSPRARTADVVGTGDQAGYVRITSNFPIHVLGVIGSRDGRTLDQLPALR